MLRKMNPNKPFFKSDTPAPREGKTIEKWLKTFPNQSDKFVSDYIAFQLSIYSESDVLGKGNIQVNWIFGEKAIERWSKKKDGAYHVINNLKKDFGFNEKTKTLWNISLSYQELQRQTTQRNEANFLNCFELDLYSDKSSTCANCKFLELCQKEPVKVVEKAAG
jgi:hypothetical protein